MNESTTKELQKREDVPLEATYSALPFHTDEGILTELEPYITVEDDEIEATEVSLVPTKAEQERRTRKKIHIYAVIAVFGVVVVVIAVTVPIFIFLDRRKEDPKLDWSSPPSLEPTLSPTYSPTYKEYIDFFSIISNRTLLTKRDTPQHKALQWIYHYDPAGRRSLSHPKLNQRYIAAVFYYSTSLGVGWSDCYPGDVLCHSDSKSAWFGSDDECNWYGFVECNSDGFVRKFSMLNNQNTEDKTKNGNGLHGFLPSEFGYLENLTDLTIARNRDLTSTIPSTFSKLTYLISWVFNYNDLEGPLPDGLFDNMTNLQELYLNYNNFQSTLPADLRNAKSLKRLELVGNSFQGTIPRDYGQLQQLQTLVLNENYLTGSIPAELGLLSSLEYFTLNNNILNGSVSNTIFVDMPHLSELDFSNNMLEGRVPENLGNVGKFNEEDKFVNLASNYFTGNIPSTLAQLLNLRELLLHNTTLSGKVPEEICHMKSINSTITPIITVDCELVECDCCSPSCEPNG